MQTKNNNISFVFIKTKRVTNYAHDLTEFRSFVRGFWPFISMHAYYMIISRVSTYFLFDNRLISYFLVITISS